MVLCMALVDDFLSCRYFWMSSSLPFSNQNGTLPMYWFLKALYYNGILTPWGVQERGVPHLPYGFLEPPPLGPQRSCPTNCTVSTVASTSTWKRQENPSNSHGRFVWENPASQHVSMVTRCSGQCCGCMVWSLRPGRICWRPRSTSTFTGQQGIKWINPSIN